MWFYSYTYKPKPAVSTEQVESWRLKTAIKYTVMAPPLR